MTNESGTRVSSNKRFKHRSTGTDLTLLLENIFLILKDCSAVKLKFLDALTNVVERSVAEHLSRRYNIWIPASVFERKYDLGTRLVQQFKKHVLLTFL